MTVAGGSRTRTGTAAAVDVSSGESCVRPAGARREHEK